MNKLEARLTELMDELYEAIQDSEHTGDAARLVAPLKEKLRDLLDAALQLGLDINY